MTEYVYEYPLGAIETEVQILPGQTLYGVHGLGSSSFLTVMENVRNLHTNSLGYRKIEYTVGDRDDPWDSECCLGDFNILHHHNQHYLFHNRKDAEAYLAYAKENTGETNSDPWWNDYDYGDEA